MCGALSVFSFILSPDLSTHHLFASLFCCALGCRRIQHDPLQLWQELKQLAHALGGSGLRA